MKYHERKIFLLVVSTATFFSGCGGNSTPPPPISVVVAPATQSVDEGQAVNITATVLNDPSGKGVNWTVSCAGSACGKVSGQTATSASYTAPSPITAALSVKITAKSIADSSKSGSATLSVVAPPVVITTSLPSATGGISYSAEVQGAGGIVPLNWTLIGSLPAGLALGSDGTISGTPTAGGTTNFSVQVADSGSPPLTATANLSLEVVVLPLSIATASLPNGAVDTAYKQQLQATGGIPPYSWTISNGSLPSWGELNPANGIVSGIPAATGTDNFTVHVADSQTTPASALQPLSITTVLAGSANNSELNGKYAFLFEGFDDVSGMNVAAAGSFTADGKGSLTAGMEDENGPSGPQLGVTFAGTYNIGPDNRGAFTIVSANGPRTYSLVLNSITKGVARKGRFVEFDDSSRTSGRRGAGILRLQDTTAFSQSMINGPYAFGFSGRDSDGNREALVGSFSADGTGTISIGNTDQNIAGTLSTARLSGEYQAPSASTGRTAITLTISGLSNLQMYGYVVSAAELLAISTGSVSPNGLLSGTILSQTSSSFQNSSFNGMVVYYHLGSTPGTPPTQSVAEVGRLGPDGNGNLSAEFDSQVGSAIIKTQIFSATYSVGATGRVSINGWHGDATSPARVLYLVDQNKGFFLDSGTDAGLGSFEGQSAGPAGGFTNASFTGTFSAATIPPSASENLNGTGQAKLDGAGSFSETSNVSTLAGWFVDQKTTGTYSIAASGRATVTSLNTTNAAVNVGPLLLAAIAALLLGCRRKQRDKPRPTLAMFCFALWIATTPASCPPPPTNQLVFYLVSPTKAVMLNEQSFDHTPEITIIEQ